MSAQKNKPIYVTQPLLPPLQKLLPCLKAIWEHKILTNGGPFHRQLEQAIVTVIAAPALEQKRTGSTA